MIYPKRLIEVDLPIKRISAHARREKSIRHGHISTLHIWWARRPLAACRAVICAALWPDPADAHCPAAFIQKARELMLSWTTHERQALLSAESRSRFEAARQQPKKFDDVKQLRGALLDFIADFANWDSSTVPEFLATSRALTQAAHEALAEEGVVGADAIFACLGPALEIFSRYSRVEKASGETVTLKEYLEQVWAAVAKEALALVFKDADTTAFEPDARLTAMWLWTLKADAADDAAASAEESDSEEEDESKGKSAKAKGGFVLEYDAARKIAQGLGAHLENLAALVEVSGETARLLPVAERAQHLFGKDDTLAGKAAQRKKRDAQMDMFKVLGDAAEAESTFGETKVSRVGETALDRVHQSMILFAAGRSEALKRFLVDDGIGKDARFWSLAQALSALYPSSTEEKRWVDGVLARKKGLGF